MARAARTPGAPRPITGLPAALTGPTHTIAGAFSLAVRPSDGAVLAGPMGEGAIDLHVMTLQGLAVTSTKTINMGRGQVFMPGGITRIESVDHHSKNMIVIGEFCRIVRGS